MRAIRIHRTGGPEVLDLEEGPAPAAPAAGQVLIRNRYAGVNFVDLHLRRVGQLGAGVAATFPITPGNEGAGVVEQVGAGVQHLRPGDNVAWMGKGGGYASHTCTEAMKVVKVPDGVSLATAAAVIFQGATAHYLCTDLYRLKPAMRCVVHAAASGVGQLLVQMAKNAGARVLGTVSSDEKEAVAREVGCEQVLRHDRKDLAAEVRRWAGGSGVEVVYDSIGKPTFQASLESLAPRGMLVLYGNAGGKVDPIDPFVLAEGSTFLTRPHLRHYTRTLEETQARTDALFAWVASGALKVRIHAELPLEQAAEAHRMLEGRRVLGKVLLAT